MVVFSSDWILDFICVEVLMTERNVRVWSTFPFVVFFQSFFAIVCKIELVVHRANQWQKCDFLTKQPILFISTLRFDVIRHNVTLQVYTHTLNISC